MHLNLTFVLSILSIFKTNFKDYFRKKHLPSSFLKPVTEKIVLEFISPMNNKESAGPDAISTNILKHVAQIIITRAHKD